MYEQNAPSPSRLIWLQQQKKHRRTIRIWQIALLAGLFAVWELTTALGLSDGFLISSPSRMPWGSIAIVYHSRRMLSSGSGNLLSAKHTQTPLS